MTVINPTNYFKDHEFNGSHKLTYPFDANGQVIMNPAGIGGASGKTKVFAEKFAGADMGAKINAAIDDLAGIPGGIVIIPAGIHTISTPIAPANASSYVTVMGAGYGAVHSVSAFQQPKVRLIQGATNTGIINLTAKGQLSFLGLQLEGINNHISTLVYGYSSAYVLFRDCAIYSGYNGADAVYLGTASNNWLFESCYLGRYNGALGARCLRLSDCYAIQLINCRGKCNGPAIVITGSSASYGYDFLFGRCGWHAGDLSANNYDAYYIDNSGQCDKIRIVDCWQDEASDTRYGVNVQTASPGFIGIYGGKMAGVTGPWNDRDKIAAIVGVET